jgi:GWxTD domain-containing protein
MKLAFTGWSNGSVAMAMLAGFVASMPVQGQELTVTMYRSWQPPDITVINGLFRVDGAMLQTGPTCEYGVRLTVTDEAGTALVNNEWDGRCPPARNGVPAGALETFQFAVVPSHYSVEVTVTPKTGGSPLRVRVPIGNLPDDALASDLILARQAGWVDDSAVADVQWTIRKGQLGIAAASEVVAEEERPQVAYYLEIYPSATQPMSGKLIGVIRRLDGMQIARMDLQAIDNAEVSRPLAGNVSLEGLAPGEYVLETRLELADTTILRSHPFRMQGKVTQEAPPNAAGASNEYFQSLSPEQLKELFDPVIVTLKRQADRDLYLDLNPDGRRNFLYTYFGGVSPTPGGGGDNFLDLYLERVGHINREFGERQGGRAGWQTDRGRIWLQHGKPPTIVSRPLPRGGAAPYEIWSYNVPSYAYLFVDDARIGAFQLIFTNDPLEQSRPDWETRISEEALEDLVRLGIPIRAATGDRNE